MEIVQNVHLILNVVANPYLIIDSDGLTLIDSGIPGSEKKILKYINGLGYKSTDVKRILITHADFDHIGGLAALKKVSGASVYASKIEAEAIGIGRSSRQLKPEKLQLKLMYALANRYAKTAPVLVDEFLVDGQMLDILGGLQVVDTAGHTPGHISFLAPTAGILFAGDSMVSDDNGLYRSVKDNTWDHTIAIESVRKQVALGASIVCPGHGPIVRNALGKFPQL
jgi:glyoxylase-like metal-dependent hydrolase (beta-lactamase superfamily II)